MTSPTLEPLRHLASSSTRETRERERVGSRAARHGSHPESKPKPFEDHRHRDVWRLSTVSLRWSVCWFIWFTELAVVLGVANSKPRDQFTSLPR